MSVSESGQPEILHPPEEVAPAALIQAALRAVRLHLGMEVAFVGEFRGGFRVFRAVDQAVDVSVIKVGEADSLEDSYCQYVVDREFPELIPDTSEVPATRAIAATSEVPVGAHVSVPIRLSSGQLYGTFCCFSRNPNPSLRSRDLEVMRMFADVVASALEQEQGFPDPGVHRRQRVEEALERGEPALVFQPVYDLRSKEMIGVEALARFASDPDRRPDAWFADAWAAGLGIELELAALRQALEHMSRIPEEVFVSVNLSPEVMVTHQFADLVADVDSLHRLVLEVTEHSDALSYADMLAALEGPMDRGMRLAVDDVGVGYGSLSRILQISPEIIKLDMSLTHHIESDMARQALASAVVAFGLRVDCQVIAEGVETRAEFDTLKVLGVGYGQGFHLGRPAPLSDLF